MLYRIAIYRCICSQAHKDGVLTDRLLFWNIASASENIKHEPGQNTSYKIVCAPSEDSDQPAHPRSLIRVFAGHSVGSQISEASLGGQWRLWEACVDVQADLSLCWVLMQFCRKCCGRANSYCLQNIHVYVWISNIHKLRNTKVKQPNFDILTVDMNIFPKLAFLQKWAQLIWVSVLASREGTR